MSKEQNVQNNDKALHIGVVSGSFSEEFIEGFTSDMELTPIDIVSEITGLTYDEIRSCSKIVCVG